MDVIFKKLNCQYNVNILFLTTQSCLDSYLGEQEETVRVQHVGCMSVHVGTAGCTERAQRVEAGHIEHQADVVCVQDGAEELGGGVFQRLEAIAVGQTQEVQQHLLPRRAEAGAARVQVVEQHGEGLSTGLLQTHLGLGLGLLHSAIQQSPERNIETQWAKLCC